MSAQTFTPGVPATAPAPQPVDWRKYLEDFEPDPDDEEIPTPLDVIEVLGFDPADEE